MTQDIQDRRAQLAAHLDAARITGEVATPREGNLAHIHRFLSQERQFDFGVRLERDWDYESVFALMVERVGLRPDPAFAEGVDTISAEKCIAALDRMRAVLEETVTAGGRILFASGHPAGLLPVHEAVAEWAQERGAEVVAGEACAADPATLRIPVPAPVGGDVRRLGRVHVWHQHGGVPHTHLAEPMHALLDALEAAGAPQPDLVVADHGWAGAAGSRGVRTVGYADCNDPALFVAEAQGQVEVSVPLDDDVVPQLYGPMLDYLLR
ncbi:phosphatase [Brevibacterium album]|uniref:phosphatase n=1 Tax=Brevibacterium album TaxID=417948 RepID=UPI00040DCAB6|nr:phosphatase [Brevibacterium album]